MKNDFAIASWSGGKDSCFACYQALKDGFRIKYLLNFITKEHKRGCFHGIEAGLLAAQAEAIGIPLVQQETSPDMQKYEEEFKEAVLKIKSEGMGTMIFGDIYLLDQLQWVERVCGNLGIIPIRPLWKKPTLEIVDEFLALGFKTVIVSCKADVMGKEYIGQYLSGAMARDLQEKGVCPCGENGEFHTFVVDGPIFNSRIELMESEPVLKKGFWEHWFLDIKRYGVIKKNPVK